MLRNMTWIENIANSIQGVLRKSRRPLNTAIPPAMMLCELNTRPGMSAIVLTAQIITELEKRGIPMGPNPDGSPNLVAQTIQVCVECLINHIKDYGVVNGYSESGAIETVGQGANAGGPVVVKSTNLKAVKMVGGLN